MKTRALTVMCALAIGWCSVSPSDAMSDGSPEAVVADTLVARPACFVATVVGAACFVVALPFAALSKSVKKTGNILVVKPAQATFTRPLGDFGDMDF